LRLLALITVIVTGIILIYGTVDMPDWGDPNSPASKHVSPEYIEQAFEKTATPNIVTGL